MYKILLLNGRNLNLMSFFWIVLLFFAERLDVKWNTFVNIREKISVLFFVIRGMVIKYVYNVGF